jgi:CRP/FNR family transcriptional regulator, nitrogen fixation regulation protein
MTAPEHDNATESGMLATPLDTNSRPNAISFGAAGLITLPAAGASRGHILEALEPRATTVHAERDEEIFAQDAKAGYCFRVVSGCVRTVQLMEDGRRQIGEFLFAGDLFGWDAPDTHDFSAEAVSPVTLRRYVRRDVDALADQDRGVARRLRDLATERLRSGRQHMVLLGRKTAAERIASFLLTIVERISEDGCPVVKFPMNRSDMGDYLGLTIETVCRRLTQLQQDGMITVKGPAITIRDHHALGAADGRIVH